jgi:hypothetical protein
LVIFLLSAVADMRILDSFGTGSMLHRLTSISARISAWFNLLLPKKVDLLHAAKFYWLLHIDV